MNRHALLSAETASKTPCLFFMHIAKTAGTSLTGLLASMFPSQACQYFSLVAAYGGTTAGVDALLDLDPCFWDRHSIVLGHMALRTPLLLRCPRPRLLLSVLREPVGRAVSYYEFVRRAPEHGLHRPLMSRTLWQAYQEVPQFRDDTLNAQLTQVFGGFESEHIERRLAEEPHIIGSIANLEAFVVAVEAATGRQRPHPLKRLNQAQQEPGLERAKEQPDFARAITAIGLDNWRETAFLNSLHPVLLSRGTKLTAPRISVPARNIQDRTISMDQVQQVSREAAAWAIRLFAGREPADEAELEFHRGHPDLASLRLAFAQTQEFQEFLRRHCSRQPYAAPLFLLQPPAQLGIPWHFAPPQLAAPTSQLCTASQFAELSYQYWCQALRITPVAHRKAWEFCYVLAVLKQAGMLRPGARGLGFGVGREALPAVLASFGVAVMATDAPFETVQGQGWDSTNQHAQGLEALQHPDILDNATLRERVGFRSVDMNAIPADLCGFDFCWSSCAFEHLGSIDHGLRFVEASLETLVPGGVAVHTTEFNLSSNGATFEAPGLSLFRKRDIEALAARLTAAGHDVWPLNFHPGDQALDEHIDLPPYAMPHLKLLVAQYVTTSIGIAVRRG